MKMPVYAVKSKYHYDEHDADLLGIFVSKDDAERILYYNIIDTAISTGDVIRQESYDKTMYNVASSYSFWIEEKYIEVK